MVVRLADVYYTLKIIDRPDGGYASVPGCRVSCALENNNLY